MFNRINFKNFSFVFFGKVIVSITHGIFYLGFASILTPDNYGELSYLIAIAGTFSIIFRFGTPYYVTIQQAKNNSIISNDINILGLILISVSSIILLFINPLASILCFGISIFILNQHNFLGKQNYKTYMINSIIKGGLIIILPFSLYFVFDVSGILLGMAFSNIICGISLLKNTKFTPNIFNNFKLHLKNLFHNFGIDVSSNLVRLVDKLAIAPLMGFTFVGIYQLNLQVLTLMEILPMSLHSFLLSQNKKNQNFKKLFFIVLPSSVGFVLIAIVSFPTFIELLFPEYSEGILSFQLLAISLIPLSIMAVYNARLQFLESKFVGVSALIRISSMLSLIIILGPAYGLMGLSSAFLISSTLTTIFLAIVYHFKIKNLID